MEMTLAIIVAVLIFVLFAICGASFARSNERNYGYVSLPNGKDVEGWVEYYEPAGNGMVDIRINGITYYTHCSKITLEKK